MAWQYPQVCSLYTLMMDDMDDTDEQHVPMDAYMLSPQVKKEDMLEPQPDLTQYAGPSYVSYQPQYAPGPYMYSEPPPSPINTAPPPNVYIHQGPPPHHPAPVFRSPVITDPAFPPQTYPLPYYSQPQVYLQPAPQSAYTPQFIYAPPPSAPIPPAPYSAPPFSGTISPAAIGHWQTADIRPNRSFSDLINSRESVSSEGSESGADWTPGTQVSVLNEWTPLQAALPEEPSAVSSSVGTVKASPPISTVPLIASGDAVPSTALKTALRDYMNAPNRLDYGERKMIIMSPKVGQKSYGNEKRFLCPHPQAILIGKSWWRKTTEGEATAVLPPRVNISITGEAPVKDAGVAWHATDGTEEPEEKIASLGHGIAGETPFHGIAAGKSLHISDADGKRRDVKAVVTVKAPLSGLNGGHVLGAFDSKEIKVISKPSKKKSNAKSSEREFFPRMQS